MTKLNFVKHTRVSLKGHPDFDEKYYTMIERFVLAVCFLLPGFWGPAVAAVWLVAIYNVRFYNQLDFSWFGFYVGGSVAALCGLAVRFLWSV